jgi:hypothetical protein
LKTNNAAEEKTNKGETMLQKQGADAFISDRETGCNQLKHSEEQTDEQRKMKLRWLLSVGE